MWQTENPSSVCSVVNVGRIPAFLWLPLDEGSAAVPKKQMPFLWSYLQVSLHRSGMWGTNFHSWCSSMQMSSYISLHFYWILWWKSKKGEQGVCPYLCCSHKSAGEHNIHHRTKVIVSYLLNPGMWTSQLKIITTITQCWRSQTPPTPHPLNICFQYISQCILVLIFKEFQSFRPSMYKEVQPAFIDR